MQLSANPSSFFFFFFNDTATTEIYTLSLHDALPICPEFTVRRHKDQVADHSNVIDSLLADRHHCIRQRRGDRKSTRLNSSHTVISYAVFCLKKKKHDGLPQWYHPPRKKQLRRIH